MTATLNTFFAVASPTTLASLAADVRSYGTNDPEQLQLAAQAEMELRNNVGNEEAAALIESAGKGN
jgi:hypothetical protein